MCNKHDKVLYNLCKEIYLHAYLHANVSTTSTCVSQMALRRQMLHVAVETSTCKWISFGLIVCMRLFTHIFRAVDFS